MARCSTTLGGGIAQLPRPTDAFDHESEYAGVDC